VRWNILLNGMTTPQRQADLLLWNKVVPRPSNQSTFIGFDPT
jgi:hypothetical protein